MADNASLKAILTTSTLVDGNEVIRIHQKNHRISWQRHGTGTAILELSSKKPESGERWLSIHLAEHAEKHSKETMLTLYGDSARQVYEYLKSVFEAEG